MSDDQPDLSNDLGEEPADVDEEAEGDDEDDEPGMEDCPICSRRNWPGAGDTCEHFVGIVWDGDFHWSDDSDNFECARGSFSELLQEVEETVGTRRFRRVIMRLTAENPRRAELVEAADPESGSARMAAEQLASFWEGPDCETTDTLLSGSGYSLYHENPRIFLDLAKEYEDLEVALRSALST